MVVSKERQIKDIENRIALLKERDEMGNINIIHKLERKLRKLTNEN